MTPDAKLIVVGLGEALFDRFPDRVILGGAPLNLAFQAHQVLSTLGKGHGTVASRVGADELGDRVIDELQDRTIPTRYVQRDANRPTGDVVIELDANGDAHYSITSDVAWDAMQFDDEWAGLATRCNAVCFGTLAQRNATSRQAIYAFLSAAENSLRICDVNLRMDFYDESILRQSVSAANIVKLNEDELNVLRPILDLGAESDNSISLARSLIRAFGLRLVALTRGAKGTQLITLAEVVEGTVPTIERETGADTVGAGDASCAGLIVGLLLEWELDEVLRLSNRMGAYVAARAGATAELDGEMREWISGLVG